METEDDVNTETNFYCNDVWWITPIIKKLEAVKDEAFCFFLVTKCLSDEENHAIKFKM